MREIQYSLSSFFATTTTTTTTFLFFFKDVYPGELESAQNELTTTAADTTAEAATRTITYTPFELDNLTSRPRIRDIVWSFLPKQWSKAKFC